MLVNDRVYRVCGAELPYVLPARQKRQRYKTFIYMYIIYLRSHLSRTAPINIRRSDHNPNPKPNPKLDPKLNPKLNPKPVPKP